jgi:excisionase family DNA binding protein
LTQTDQRCAVVVTEPNAVYKVEQIAALLDLKPGAVRKWIGDGKLRTGKLGKSYLVVGSDLLAAIRGEEPRQVAEEPEAG